MADKDKHEDKHETHDAPVKKEAAPPPKPSKEAMLQELLTLYAHNLENAGPRSPYELELIRQIVAAK
jgi:hypothetical protein